MTDTPLLNQVNTTTGYVLDTGAINNIPLGTGSFTQLAILSPGLSADFLSGSGSNAGLGNTPSFDVPTTNASQYSVKSGVPTVVALPSSFGLIQHTIGSPRFLQLSATFAF